MQTQSFINKCEFSLTDQESLFPNQIVGRLSIPGGIERKVIREFLSASGFDILRQRCIGNETHTTGWSKLYFKASVKDYEQLLNCCRPSNLRVVREATTKLLAQLLEAEPAVVCEQIPVKQEVSAQVELESKPLEELPTTQPQQPVLTFTDELLKQCSLTQLKNFAKALSIEGRSKLTKNLQVAQKHLIPLLVGLPIPNLSA